MRKFQWVIPVLVAASLIGFSFVRPWLRDRAAAAEVRALTEDLRAAAAEIDQAVADTPQAPRASDVERMQQLNNKRRELIERMKEVAPRLKGETGEAFREAQDLYLRKTALMGKKLEEMLGKMRESKKAKAG